MSHASLKHVMIRIESADPDSPIAVFKSDLPGKLNAVFANTAETQRLIASSHPDYIGTYSTFSDQEAVESHLKGFLA